MTELLFRDDAYLKSCEARVTAAGEAGIETDRTVFYPMGGGQPGDSGRMRLADGRTLAIVDTRKGTEPDSVLHVLAQGELAPAPGESVTLELDWERRYRLMRMHSGLHLLSAVLPYPVTGGQIGDGKGRLDFDMQDRGDILDKEAIGRRLNELVEADHPLKARWISEDELRENPELVKTMSVKPPMGAGRVRLIDIEGLDLQACGGTHVRRTGEIGRILVRKIESKGRQNRRVGIEFA
ncbi:MAG: alanyl-tRNA editing protein [Alphaproteobacteria bacterium]|nr:alanyl-tRNA editing protein [Alphaproteobacteria bacterium]